jgi:hypothetical protein
MMKELSREKVIETVEEYCVFERRKMSCGVEEEEIVRRGKSEVR